MAKPSVRIAAIQFGFAVGVALILGRAAQLQIVDHESWSAEARRTRTAKEVLPARRGALYDRNGVPFAITQEFYHVGIAPNELTDRGAAYRLLVRSLGVSPTALDRDFRARSRGSTCTAPIRHAGAAASRGQGYSPGGGVPTILPGARAGPPGDRRPG
jgi:cell division protein FtsI/penicillin-binding protein 2